MRGGIWILIGALLVGCGTDQDEDGYKEKEDCNDNDPDIFPGAAEQCDGIDNDCDLEVDEGLLLTWFADLDEDTYGDPEGEIDACTQPSGYVENSEDCNDESADFYPGAPEDDCSDNNDYNCDGSVGYDDNDGDGFAACEGDCDDTNADINADATELCDGIDNNCDGFADLEAEDSPTWYLDHDGDLYGDASFALVLCEQPPNYVGNSDDCDDLDDTSYPGATELCDLADNDCDGTVDEDDAADVSTWYADTDEDSYGDPKVTVGACPDADGVGPEGYVGNSGDCDDTSSLVNDGAIEFCDEIDNDCDGDVDEDADDNISWFIDSDSDGYGAATSTTQSCTQPTGYVLTSDDCNDSDTDINPGATEVCDGIDNDCDGDTDDDDSSLDTSTGTTFYADGDEDGFGSSSDTVDACEQPSGYVAEDSSDCDDTDAEINPDATEICDDGDDNNCDGGDDNCELELSSSADVLAYFGETSGEGSFSLAHADLNDDGTEDIILGAYSSSNGGSSALDGAAYVFYGPVTADVSLGDADMTLTGTSGEKDAFGFSVSGTLDFTGDGVDDLAITASQTDNGTISTAGAVYIFSGDALAGSASSSGDADDADIILRGEGKQHYLGVSVSGGDDLNGDGLYDLLVGASRAPSRTTAEGAIYVLYGGITAGDYTISDVAYARIEGESADDKIGTSNTHAMVGDLDGDGSGDLVVGSYLHNSETGAAYLIAGPVSGNVSIEDVSSEMVPDSTGDYAGRGVTPAGDVNSDGYNDFWISSPREDTEGASAGAVFLMYGTSSLGSYDGQTLDTEAQFTIYGTSGGDQIGAEIVGGGDLDGDSNTDLLIGMPSYGSVSEGAAFFFYGPFTAGTSMTTAEADALFVGTASGDDAGSDIIFTGDVDGSGTDSILIDVPDDDNNPSSTSNAGAAYLVFDFGL